MHSQEHKRTARQRVSARGGFAHVIALLLLMVFSSLAVGLVATTDSAMRQSANARHTMDARLAAESGMQFMDYALRDMTPPEQGGQALLEAVAAHLSAKVDGTPHVVSGWVMLAEQTVYVPQIRTADNRTFSANLWLVEDDVLHLRVEGSSGGTSRAVSIEYQLTGGPGTTGEDEVPESMLAFFGYGIASRSKISITGNASIEGKTWPEEAELLSATYSDPEALTMVGNADLEGDVYFSNPDAYASLTGNVSIAGVSCRDDEIWGHVHTGTGDVEFPEVDPTVYEPFATNIVDGSTQTNGNKTFTNIRIKAGTNPTFSGNITINGIVFVEVPNEVRFSGNLDLTGVVVTGDAGEDAYEDNTVRFTGNTSVRGVEQLPDTPEFQGLREMPGAFLLAPGFGAEFRGNFGTISGTMAADKFEFTGNASGTVQGMIINYSDSVFSLVGNSRITIDRSDDIDRSNGTDHEGRPAVPPGFAIPPDLSPLPETYREQ